MNLGGTVEDEEERWHLGLRKELEPGLLRSAPGPFIDLLVTQGKSRALSLCLSFLGYKTAEWGAVRLVYGCIWCV